ncbi:MAG: RNA methyltransferase [Saprospiraceae bacterium]|jgi:23S rRNA (guanosine2251-2'-O)-methyltransferase|nr:RNA methyltransferase [Saprospiraceae bacterium]
MRKLKLEELGRISMEEYQVIAKVPIVAVLDSIRSALNVGSVFRTADAFAIEKIVICGISATPPNREITKTAIGATESVTWEYVEDIKDAVMKLKMEGYSIIGVEQTDQSLMLNQLRPTDEKIAVIFGNEVDGVSDEILNDLDYCIEIPQHGTKHSLNVSVCAGIVLWELAKRYH